MSDYLHVANTYDHDVDGFSVGNNYVTGQSVRLWHWVLLPSCDFCINTMETWIISNGGATMRGCNGFLNSSSTGAVALVHDATNEAVWAITITFYATTSVSVKQVSAIADSTIVSMRAIHDGSNWTFSAQASTIGGIAYTQPVAYIAKADKASICFDSAVESTAALTVDTYSTTMVISDSWVSNDLAYSLQTNALTVTNFANIPDAFEPCTVQMEFDPLLADKTYVLGDSDSFTHTAGNYITGTCAAGTIVYSAR